MHILFLYSLAALSLCFKRVVSYCVTRYLSPFDLRPRVLDKENVYCFEHEFMHTDDYEHRICYHNDCYEIMSGLSGLQCGASWYDLDRIGNTSLNEAAKDWSYFVGDHTLGIWAYAIATMIALPLLLIWPIIQIPVLSDTLAHISSSPFLRSESWMYLFPTCNVSVQPAAAYQVIYASLFLSVSWVIYPCILCCYLSIIDTSRYDGLQKIDAKCKLSSTTTYNPIQS